MSPAEMKKKAARRSIRHSRKPQTEEHPVNVAHRQPIIIRTTDTHPTGQRSFFTSRYALGYVVSGQKSIYTGGDIRSLAEPGNIFFLSKGEHRIEDKPHGHRPFEQILFFYTAEQISRIIAELGVNYSIDTCVHHTCEECLLREYVVSPGWDSLRHFFAAVGKNLRDGFYDDNPTAESLALTSLVYQIISRPEGCLRTRVLGSTDPEKELMERQLNDYVFSNITLEQFAARTNRSLSSFKKKFKEFYHEPPHRWVVRQRLMHARMQVISTDRDIIQIAAECHFPNPSHFIRLFSKEFGMTPSRYRSKHGKYSSRLMKDDASDSI